MDRTRRRVIQATGLALTGAVAGCSGDGGDETDTEADEDDSEMSGDTEDDASMDTDTDAGMMTDTEASMMTDTDAGMETDMAGGTETATESGMGTETGSGAAEVTLDNVGASAWEVTAGAEAVSAGGGENPTLTVEAGTRYVIQNEGWSAHPLAFRASDDSPLLSQSADGSYEDDDAVDWVNDDTSVAFTVTEELAADLDYYICTIHASMRGSVETA
jgi:hypothetical protein